MSSVKLPSGVPAELLDALTRSQNQLDGRLKSVDERKDELASDVERRRFIGLALKGGTVVAGILLAAGILTETQNQAAGIVVLVVVALERLFANLDRLMTNTAARDAYKRVRRQTENAHEAGIVPLIAIRDSKPEEFVRKLTTLTESLRLRLSTTADPPVSG